MKTIPQFIGDHKPPKWFDETAQSDRLTVGQQIVAAWECGDGCSLPFELALAIDAEIDRAKNWKE